MRHPPLENSVIRILNKNGNTVGAGFMIAERLAVTCAHVVAAAESGPGQKIHFDRVNPTRIALEANVTPDSWSDPQTEDVAFLKLEQQLDDLVPVICGSAADCEGHPYSSLGFPEAGPLQARRPHDLLNGVVPVSGRQPLLEMKGEEIQEGLSGAPVLDLTSGLVVGMVTGYRDSRTRLAYATTMDTLKMRHPFLILQAPGSRSIQFADDPSNEIREGFTSRATINTYLQISLNDMLNMAAPGSTTMLMDDIVGANGLFVSPPWAVYLSAPQYSNLVEFLKISLLDGKRTLLLGKPGQGKTTTLKRLFFLLANEYINEKTDIIPIFISLRTLYLVDDQSITLDLERVWKQLREENLRFPFPLGYEEFILLLKRRKLLFLFDGFDEIPGEVGQREIVKRTASSIFNQPSILSCRTNFYEVYLSASLLHEKYAEKFELLPFHFQEQVIKYIEGYSLKYKRVSPSEMIAPIQENAALKDLVTRPLLLAMVLETIDDLVHMKKTMWTTAGLYDVYTSRWLKIEAAKPDSILSWEQKNEVVEVVAWKLYCLKTMFSTRAELYRLLQNADIPFDTDMLSQVIDDLCLRTFLIGNYDDKYYFIHKSFQDYFVAKHYFQGMLLGPSRASEVLCELITPEVSNLLSDFFAVSTSDQLREIAQHLADAYMQNLGSDPKALFVRQHAGYNLGRTKTREAEHFLVKMYKLESNKWVQRGMVLGLIMYMNRLDILDEYMDLLNTDPETASVNTGYYLVYCGDQPIEDGYFDMGYPQCNNTVRDLLAHLKDSRYKNVLPIELFTLKELLRTRGLSIISNEQRSHLLNFLSQENSDLHHSLNRELQHIVTILNAG